MIQIIPYRPEWVQEFAELGRRLRQALGEQALRIDHIGSTSVPGLAAKDIIDVQITVEGLAKQVGGALEAAGFERLPGIWQDHVPPGASEAAREWEKWLFRPPAGQRPANIHVRIAARLNQRYALLFRDYLRAQPAIAEAYARAKRSLAHYHPDDKDAYYDVKDPICDIIMGGAEIWTLSTHWEQGPSDC